MTLKDDGSNEAPNINTTVAATFTITIDSANNPPTFTKGGDETVEEDSPARTVENWASGIEAGNGSDSEIGTVNFTVVPATPSLFTAGGQPAVDEAGTLTFTPAPN
ncbi:MAG: hypothetical protein ACKOA6_05260, partial [Actinomycetota bacterium]